MPSSCMTFDRVLRIPQIAVQTLPKKAFLGVMPYLINYRKAVTHITLMLSHASQVMEIAGLSEQNK